MIKNIFIKEYIKLNRVIIAVAVINIATIIYTYFRVRVGFISQQPSTIWLDIIQKGTIYYSRIQYPLEISAFIIGIMQFYPEYEKKRFRLSCHLPINENLMVLYTISFGLMLIFLIWLIDLIGVMFVTSTFFMSEMVLSIPLVMTYWLADCIILYILAVILTIEPSWNVKLRFALLLSGFVFIHSISVINSDWVYGIIYFCLALFFIPAVYYPVFRFRKGL